MKIDQRGASIVKANRATCATGLLSLSLLSFSGAGCNKQAESLPSKPQEGTTAALETSSVPKGTIGTVTQQSADGTVSVALEPAAKVKLPFTNITFQVSALKTFDGRLAPFFDISSFTADGHRMMDSNPRYRLKEFDFHNPATTTASWQIDTVASRSSDGDFVLRIFDRSEQPALERVKMTVALRDADVAKK